MFEDGFANVMYVVQRMAGNGFHDEVPWIRDIKVYPIAGALRAFDGVKLEAGDVYESCFFITLPQIVPALALVAFVMYAQMLLVTVLIQTASFITISLRDVRNTAVYFGQYNEEMKLEYERLYQGL